MRVGAGRGYRRVTGRIVRMLACAACVTVALACLSSCFMRPLNDDRILADIKPDSYLKGLTKSKWANNSGYSLASQEVKSNERDGDDRSKRVTTSELVFENKSFRVTMGFESRYHLEGDEDWKLDSCKKTSKVIEPIAGVSGGAVKGGIASLMAQTDKKHPHKRKNGAVVTLASMYKNGPNPEVRKVTFKEPGTSVATVGISATDNAFVKHGGTLKVTFTFNSKKGSWKVSDCTAGKGTYVPDLSALVGTWKGTFESTEAYWVSGATCSGGKKKPAKLVIKRIKDEGTKAVADFSVLVHNHGDRASSVISAKGDRLITRKKVAFKVRMGAEYCRVYSGINKDGGWCEVRISYNEDGTLTLTTDSGPGYDSVRDTYTMTKTA